MKVTRLDVMQYVTRTFDKGRPFHARDVYDGLAKVASDPPDFNLLMATLRSACDSLGGGHFKRGGQ